VDLSLLFQDVPTLIGVIVLVPAVLAAYIVGGEFVVRRLPDKARPAVRPWIWVGPALAFVTAFLVLPTVGTLISSFENHDGNMFVGLLNYQRQLTDFPTGGAWIAIRNNIYWLLLYTFFVLFFGLILAVIFDRVPYESLVKSLVFLPMAISSVALGVIWKFMYWYQPPGAPQTGTLNAILVNWFHQAPKTWLTDTSVNNFAIIAAAIWGITGFSMVILSAALKGIPADLLEAARVDGAGEITIFRRVIFPLMMPTVVVVGTTLVIFALKVFGEVYVMTAGNFGTDVLANRMYKLLYISDNPGGASAVAVILLIAVIPVLIFNLRQFRAVEARR
jgi:alpha-glucoside transport system permease protein